MNRSTSSIARGINWSWTIKRFNSYLVMDLIILCTVLVGWCISKEWDYYNTGDLGGRTRTFVVENSYPDLVDIDLSRYNGRLDEEFKSAYYQVEDSKGRLLTVNMYVFLSAIFIAGRGIIAIQLFVVVWTLLFGIFEIRRKLTPLDDMAKRAEELSRIAFDNTKFDNLESAIENINPDAQDEFLSTGNKDLYGIEEAINNLLKRMRDSYRQQSRFVSDASHELRTPIAVIQGYANMLDRWGKDDVNVLEESIEAIKHESNHMKTLVEQLLFLARGDAGRNQLNMQPVSLKNIIHEVFEESKMIDEKHIYELEEDKGDVIIKGDEAMIKQSVRILVDNAAKYTPEGETISLKSGINGDIKPYFSVKDNGIGMNESDVRHVFERFYRSDEARNRQTGGTGLGLAIAKWIIDRHNGYVDILSRPDIGTRFTVTFNRE